jgi:hypothetical protein
MGYRVSWVAKERRLPAWICVRTYLLKVVGLVDGLDLFWQNVIELLLL